MPSAATAADPSPKNSRPLQAALFLSALYFLSRFIGLLQSVLISALLPPVATDAYIVAFDLPNYLNYMVAGGAISALFIPLFAGMWDTGREAEAWRFFSTLISVMGVILTVLTLLMMLLAPQLTVLAKPGLLEPGKEETLRLAVAMTRIILPAQLFFYVGGVFAAVLNNFKRFGAAGWTSPVYNLVAIGVAVPFYLLTGNALGFAWGILIGAFVGNFLLPYLAAFGGPAAQRPRFVFRFRPNDASVRRFFMLALPIMLGVSLPVVDIMVVNYFTSGMGQGAITHLNNGNRLMIAAQAMVGQAAAVAAFPFLASESATGDYQAFSNLLRTGLRRLLFLTLPLSVLLMLWSQPVVSLVFGWGQYDQPAKIAETAGCFAYFCLGLFAWAAQGFLARGFFALGNTRTPTIIGSLLTLFFFIPLCAVAARWGGTYGLAMATSVGATVYFVFILVALDKFLRQRRYGAPIHLEKVLGTFLRTFTACLIMAGVGYSALWLAQRVVVHDKIGDIGLLLWTGGIAGAAFALAAEKFAIPEWFWLRDKFAGRLRRRRVG